MSSRATRTLLLAALAGTMLVPGVALAKKKDKTPPAPPVGWQTEEGWKNACYFPPDWGKMDEITRRKSWSAALDEMKSQWAGKRDDGISFGENTVDAIDTTLLGEPAKVEGVTAENLTLCKGVATGQATTAQWEAWLKALPGKLTAGECFQHLDYTMMDYLDIGTGWQRPLGMCKGDKVRIGGTQDKYRVRDNGPWITVNGDTSVPTVGGDWPCNVEGCFEGMLVARFVTEGGVELVFPVGTELTWTAPENGELNYRINDNTFYDNKWFTNGRITDHTAIEVNGAL